jgi:hypothetical protein
VGVTRPFDRDMQVDLPNFDTSGYEISTDRVSLGRGLKILQHAVEGSGVSTHLFGQLASDCWVPSQTLARVRTEPNITAMGPAYLLDASLKVRKLFRLPFGDDF